MDKAKIQILIPRSVKNKLDNYVNLTNSEISGLGDVERVRDGVFRITEIYLYKQKCSAASTSIENTDIHDFICARLETGGSVANVKFWWHSHYTMDVFWSGQDENAIQNIENDYLISLVQNHKGSIKTRIDLFQPFRTTIHDIEVLIEEDLKQEPVLITEGPGMFRRLQEGLASLFNVFEGELNTASMDNLKSRIPGRENALRAIASTLKSYASIIDKELDEASQAVIKEEIAEKVQIASYARGPISYVGSGTGKYQRDNRTFEERWNGKGLYDFDDDYGMDLIPEFRRGASTSFSRALELDDKSDRIKLESPSTESKGGSLVRNLATNVVSDWKSIRKMK